MSDYIIETHDLTKRYGNQISVSHLNIHVKKGRIYGLLGRNGAGKTTTMRMLLGLTAPTSGEVTIVGKHFQCNEKKILPLTHFAVLMNIIMICITICSIAV